LNEVFTTSIYLVYYACVTHRSLDLSRGTQYQDSLVEEQQQQQADATAKPDQPSKTAPTDVSAALAKYELQS